MYDKEIKPCPDCKGNDIGVKETISNKPTAWAYCRKCQRVGPTLPIESKTKDEAILDAAYKAWNNSIK